MTNIDTEAANGGPRELMDVTRDLESVFVRRFFRNPLPEICFQRSGLVLPKLPKINKKRADGSVFAAQGFFFNVWP